MPTATSEAGIDAEKSGTLVTVGIASHTEVKRSERISLARVSGLGADGKAALQDGAREREGAERSVVGFEVGRGGGIHFVSECS